MAVDVGVLSLVNRNTLKYGSFLMPSRALFVWLVNCMVRRLSLS